MVIPGAVTGSAGFTFRLELVELVGSAPTLNSRVHPRAANRRGGDHQGLPGGQ